MDRGWLARALADRLPPRNASWTRKGRWRHRPKAAFEKRFIREMKQGKSEPLRAKRILKSPGIHRLEKAA